MDTNLSSILGPGSEYFYDNNFLKLIGKIASMLKKLRVECICPARENNSSNLSIINKFILRLDRI